MNCFNFFKTVFSIICLSIKSTMTRQSLNNAWDWYIHHRPTKIESLINLCWPHDVRLSIGKHLNNYFTSFDEVSKFVLSEIPCLFPGVDNTEIWQLYDLYII